MNDPNIPADHRRHRFHTGASAPTPKRLPFRRLCAVEYGGLAPLDHRSGTLQGEDMVLFGLAGTLNYQDKTNNNRVLAAEGALRLTTEPDFSYRLENNSRTEAARFVQVITESQCHGSAPRCQESKFTIERPVSRVAMTDSPGPSESETWFHLALIAHGQTRLHFLSPHRHAWIHVLEGAMRVNGSEVAQGEGLGVSDARFVEVVALRSGCILLVDLE